MSDWLEILHREWPIISAAPYSFIIALVVLCTITWFVCRWFYSRHKDEPRATPAAATSSSSPQSDFKQQQIFNIGVPHQPAADLKPAPSPPIPAPKPAIPEKRFNFSASEVHLEMVRETNHSLSVAPRTREPFMLYYRAILIDITNQPHDNFDVSYASRMIAGLEIKTPFPHTLTPLT